MARKQGRKSDAGTGTTQERAVDLFTIGSGIAFRNGSNESGRLLSSEMPSAMRGTGPAYGTGETEDGGGGSALALATSSSFTRKRLHQATTEDLLGNCLGNGSSDGLLNWLFDWLFDWLFSRLLDWLFSECNRNDRLGVWKRLLDGLPDRSDRLSFT